MEIELKFVVPPSRLENLAAAMRQPGEVRHERLQARYFDTVDGRLAAHSVALRLRNEGGRWVQTVKALTPEALRRLEHNADRAEVADGDDPVLNLALHNGTAAGRALRAALGTDGDEGGGDGGPPQLVEHFRTDVERLTRLEASGGALVELALDTGHVAAGERSDAICEFELELKSGPVQALFDLAGRWAVDRGLWLGTVTKAERGGRLVAGAAPVTPVMATLPEVDPRAGPAPFLAAVLEACLKQVLGNASELGVAQGSSVAEAADEEGHVHQLRVGLRRLRTALRELDDFADGVDPAWEATFRRLFQALGEVRDADAVLPKIREALRAAGLRYSPPDPMATDGATSPAEVVHAPAVQRALLEVMAFCERATVPRPPEKRAKKRLQRRVTRRLDRLHRALVRDARRFSRLSADRQHDARKRLKRLRYLAEFAAPLFGPKRVRRYLKSWRAAQDALGESNDLRVCLALMRADPQPGADRRIAIRWTLGELQTLVERCERALRKAVRTKTFWRA